MGSQLAPPSGKCAPAHAQTKGTRRSFSLPVRCKGHCSEHLRESAFDFCAFSHFSDFSGRKRDPLTQWDGARLADMHVGAPPRGVGAEKREVCSVTASPSWALRPDRVPFGTETNDEPAADLAWCSRSPQPRALLSGPEGAGPGAAAEAGTTRTPVGGGASPGGSERSLGGGCLASHHGVGAGKGCSLAIRRPGPAGQSPQVAQGWTESCLPHNKMSGGLSLLTHS